MGAREARAKRELRIVEAFGRPLSDAGSIPAASIIERGPHTGEGLFFCQDQLSSETWIDRLTFQGQYTEDAFVHTVERFSTDEALQRLNAERKLPECQRTLGR